MKQGRKQDRKKLKRSKNEQNEGRKKEKNRVIKYSEVDKLFI